MSLIQEAGRWALLFCMVTASLSMGIVVAVLFSEVWKALKKYNADDGGEG